MYAKCLQPGNPSPHHPVRRVIPHPPPIRDSLPARGASCLCLSVVVGFFVLPVGIPQNEGEDLFGPRGKNSKPPFSRERVEIF